MVDLERLHAGDRRTLAKAITLIESTRPDHRLLSEQLLEQIMPDTGNSLRLGISGVPGVGKSTLIDALGRLLISHELSVAVLTVDPTSSLSGGAILGDKTRMNWLSSQPSAFIRPSPAGMMLGGVSRRTREAILLCEFAGFEIVIVETVGVGQSESLVSDMTDLFILLLLPGAGDELQGIKRGIMELADLVVVNKADGDMCIQAQAAVADLHSALQLLRPRLANWVPPVLAVSSLEQRGIDQVWQKITEYEQVLRREDEFQARRRKQSLAWLWRETGEILLDTLRQDPALHQQLSTLQKQVLDGTIPPSVAAARLTREYLTIVRARPENRFDE